MTARVTTVRDDGTCNKGLQAIGGWDGDDAETDTLSALEKVKRKKR